MNKKEPLMHVVKRDSLPASKRVLIRVIAIVIAIIVCGVLTSLTAGISAIDVYSSMVKGSFGSARKTWITFQDVSILLLIALALTPAFKMKFWNIGGEGQVLMGGLGAAIVMIKLADKLPNPLVMLLMVLASIVLGGLWGFIPAFFKAKWNTNETLSTLMLNYIGTQIVSYFVVAWAVPKGSGKIGIINQDSHIGWLPNLFDSKYLLCIMVALLTCVSLYYYFNKSKQGYELRVVGESVMTARYVGISVERVIIRTMILSGALCGIVGCLLVGSVNHTITTTIAGGQGFTAVMVSWMAKFNPFTMILTSFVIAFMENGSGEIATNCGLNQSFSSILTGIILFFIIGCEFFITYKVQFRKKKVEANTDNTSANLSTNEKEETK